MKKGKQEMHICPLEYNEAKEVDCAHEPQHSFLREETVLPSLGAGVSNEYSGDFETQKKPQHNKTNIMAKKDSFRNRFLAVKCAASHAYPICRYFLPVVKLIAIWLVFFSITLFAAQFLLSDEEPQLCIARFRDNLGYCSDQLSSSPFFSNIVSFHRLRESTEGEAIPDNLSSLLAPNHISFYKENIMKHFEAINALCNAVGSNLHSTAHSWIYQNASPPR